jgi:hypothetical protein
MERRSNWKPVIVPNGRRAENGKIGKDETIPHAAQSKGAPTGDEEKLVDIRFTVGVALVLGLPVLIAAGLYLAATVVLR